MENKDKNQLNFDEIVIRIIREEVLVCQTSLVEHLLQSEDSNVDLESIENFYPSFVEESSGGICESCDEEDVELNSESVCRECFEDQRDPQEIYEWWAVSRWLKEKLIQIDAPILDCELGTWWGRTETGQSLSQDWHLQEIARRLLGAKEGVE